jgi:hypothetical protein
MITAMDLLIRYLKQNKELSIDAVIVIAEELKNTAEKDNLIRSYIGYIDETVTKEQLEDAYRQAYAFYNFYWDQPHAIETQITAEKTNTEGQQEDDK